MDSCVDLLPAGGVLVADSLRVGGGDPVPCPAAPLLAGELRRCGVAVVTGPLSIGTDGFATHHELIDRDGLTDVGLGVGVLPSDLAAEKSALAALAAWATVAAARTILLASPRAFCAGVDRAIAIVEQALRTGATLVYVRKQIVHNRHVVGDLARRGAIFVEELDEVPDGSVVVFSAHGVSPAVRAEAAERNLDVIDGTCPLVAKVHSEARRFAARGDTVVFIGHDGHEEVEGTIGEAPDAIVLVESAADVRQLTVADPRRVSYLTQTTLAVDETADVVDALREKFPALRELPSDDICYASTNRQNSLKVIMSDVDLVLVVGSGNSSNSVRLVEVSRRHGTPAHLIDHAGDIQPDWLHGVTTVGLTAGASAPPGLVDDVVAALAGLGTVTVHEREVTRETIHFGLPGVVRDAANGS